MLLSIVEPYEPTYAKGAKAMAINYELMTILSNTTAKRVLHTVAAGKAVHMRELVQNDISEDEALEALRLLKDAHLVKETQSPLASLKTYFVTANGLQADREYRAYG